MTQNMLILAMAGILTLLYLVSKMSGREDRNYKLKRNRRY